MYTNWKGRSSMKGNFLYSLLFSMFEMNATIAADISCQPNSIFACFSKWSFYLPFLHISIAWRKWAFLVVVYVSTHTITSGWFVFHMWVCAFSLACALPHFTWKCALSKKYPVAAVTLCTLQPQLPEFFRIQKWLLEEEKSVSLKCRPEFTVFAYIFANLKFVLP